MNESKNEAFSKCNKQIFCELCDFVASTSRSALAAATKFITKNSSNACGKKAENEIYRAKRRQKNENNGRDNYMPELKDRENKKIGEFLFNFSLICLRVECGCVNIDLLFTLYFSLYVRFLHFTLALF